MKLRKEHEPVIIFPSFYFNASKPQEVLQYDRHMTITQARDQVGSGHLTFSLATETGNTHGVTRGHGRSEGRHLHRETSINTTSSLHTIKANLNVKLNKG